MTNGIVSALGFKGLYGDMDRDPLCHVADSDCLPLGDSSLLTPIDCLYSMQDSYFASWGRGQSSNPSFALLRHLSVCTVHMVFWGSGYKINLQWACGCAATPRNIPCAPPLKHCRLSCFTNPQYYKANSCASTMPSDGLSLCLNVRIVRLYLHLSGPCKAQSFGIGPHLVHELEFELNWFHISGRWVEVWNGI